MLKFDTDVLESTFPELSFIITKDDNGAPFLAHALNEGEHKNQVWSYEDIDFTNQENPNIKIVNYDVFDIGMDDDKELRKIQEDYFFKFMNVMINVLEDS
jgi:hypothetical protein